MKSILRSSLAAIAIALACTSLSAQAVPSLTSGFSSDKRDPNVPTDISAMSMDINMRKNLITLMGDVFLDDQQATIQCNKMIIHLEDKAPDKDAKDDKSKKDGKDKKDKPLTTTPDENGNAQIAGDKTATLVECFEDVVIIPKNKKPTADGKKPEEIKATANKAIYDLVKNEVTLLENPVVINGSNKIVGSKIIFLVNEDRVIITRGKATTKEGLDSLRQNKGE